MSSSTLQAPARPQDAAIKLVDCDIHPTVRSMKDLHPYLSARWREHLDTFGQRFRQAFVASTAFPKATPALADGAMHVIDPGNGHVFGYVRQSGQGRVLALCNFSEQEQRVAANVIRANGLSYPFLDSH